MCRVPSRATGADASLLGESMKSFIDQFAYAIQTVEDIRPAAERMRDAGAAMGGFRVAALDNISTGQPMTDADGADLSETVFGWHPRERWWVNGRALRMSPIIRACRYESEPFWCNAQGIYSRQPSPCLANIDPSDLEKLTSRRSVLIVPVHLPLARIGVAAFYPSDTRDDLSDIYEEYADDLAVLTHRFIAGYAKVRREQRKLPDDGGLTKREVECLHWAAVGKTDREIGMIISRSHATVRFHIKNAAHKLDTVGRCHTIFKATQLGYLGVAH